MAIENGEWIMRGLDWDDPSRIRSWEELIGLINEVGFLPLFKNEIPGFSVEEHTSDLYWWTGDEEQDPWEWRELIARSGQVAYGKFFGKKAGFISREWFPHFANYRRDGYDFDSRWDEELASMRCKRIMDQFESKDELFSFELKRLAGFGKDGEKNFEGTVTDLQMQSYLLSGAKDGSVTMDHFLLELAQRGVIMPETAIESAYDPAELQKNFLLR